MTTQQNTAVARPFDKANLTATMQPTGGGALTFAPSDFSGLMEVANLMAASGVAIPKHLRQSPGMCLSVAMVAYQNGFNPFLLAADTYVVNDVLAYGAKSIAAMVNNCGRMNGRLHYDLSGQWPNRRCAVTGHIKGDAESKVLEVKAETITTRNSPLWKQQPDQQFIYYSTRAWSRVYMPEVLLGLLGSDEIGDEDYRGPDNAKDVTPPRPTRASVAAAKSAPVIDAEAVESEPPPTFDFTGYDGEFRDGLTAQQFADTFCDALNEAGASEIADGIWETNSPQLQALRDTGPEGVKLADLIDVAYDGALTRLRIDQKDAEPKQAQEAHAATAFIPNPEWVKNLPGFFERGNYSLAKVGIDGDYLIPCLIAAIKAAPNERVLNKLWADNGCDKLDPESYDAVAGATQDRRDQLAGE